MDTQQALMPKNNKDDVTINVFADDTKNQVQPTQPVIQPVQPITEQPQYLVQENPLPQDSQNLQGTLLGQDLAAKSAELGGLQEQYQSNQEAINALGGYGPEVVKALSDTTDIDTQINRMQKMQELHKENIGKTLEDIATYKKQVDDGTIDPNRLMGSMSTGNKILAFIGMTLAGATPHTMQMAQTIYQNAIRNDIEAQKLLLGKKETLYSNALKKYGNEMQAELMTEAKLNSMVISKLNQKIKLAQSPYHIANLLKMREGLIEKNNQVLNKMGAIQGAVGTNLSNYMASKEDAPIHTAKEHAYLMGRGTEGIATAQRKIIGLSGQAATKEERDAIKVIHDDTIQANRLINELLDITNDSIFGRIFKSSDVVFKNKKKLLAEKLTDLLRYNALRTELGVHRAPSIQEIKSIHDLIDQPEAFWSKIGDLRSALMLHKQEINSSYIDKASSAGYGGFEKSIKDSAATDIKKLLK